MATYYSNSNNGYRLRLDVTNRDGNSATNTSVVDYGFYLEQTNKQFNGAVQTGDLSINGVSLYTKPASFNSTVYPYNSSILLKSGSLTVSHNSDGSKTVSLVANYSANSGGFGPVGLTINTTFGLTTIPRASQPRLSVATQNLGDTITIYTDRASTSFTHTLTYAFGNQSGTIATGVGDSTSWVLPNDLAWSIPNNLSGVGGIYCDTYNGDTLIGSKGVSFTATVPNNATFQPTASISSIVENGDVPSWMTVFVQNKSKVKVTSSGAGKYSSTIKTYSVSVAGIGTYTGSVITSDFLRNSGTVRVTLTVTDSRGLNGSTYQDITVVAYSPPQLPTFNAQRSESTPTEISASFSASISPIDDQNNKYFRIRSKASDGGWVEETDTTQHYSFNGTQTILSDPDKSYTIEFFIQDAFTSVTQTVQVGTAFTLIDFNTSGKGMAIGKVSESDSFEVTLPTHLYNGFSGIQINAHQQQANSDLSTAGWYRVAEFDTWGEQQGRFAYGMVLEAHLRRTFSYTSNEAYKLTIVGAHNAMKIYAQGVANVQAFTKARWQVNGTKAYLDVYYNLNNANTCLFNITSLSTNAIDFKQYHHFSPISEEDFFVENIVIS